MLVLYLLDREYNPNTNANTITSSNSKLISKKLNYVLNIM
jgi:hypothetical protein